MKFKDCNNDKKIIQMPLLNGSAKILSLVRPNKFCLSNNKLTNLISGCHRDSMACADSPIGIWRVQEEADTEDQAGPLIKYYQPLKPLRAERRPLHALLGTAPAVLGVT